MPESKYCALVKHGISVGTEGILAPCCQFDYIRNPPEENFNFTQLKEFKESMALLDSRHNQGIEDPRCKQCWYDEKIGYKSQRQHFNEKYLAEENPHGSETWHMEIRLGNFCNLKCIMCHPRASSSIETEYIENKQSFNQLGIFYDTDKPIKKWWSTDAFLDFLDQTLSEIKHLQFTGGEPFMVPTLSDILQKVKNPKSTDLLFVTNMTKLNTEVIELTKRFNLVNVIVSLEGINDKNGYIRFPSDFSEIESNIEKIKQIADRNLHWGISHTFQHTSIYSLPDLISWADSMDLSIHFSTFAGWDYLDIDSVPPADIEKFRAWLRGAELKDAEMRNYIEKKLNGYQFKQDLYQQFRKYVKTLDTIRGTDYDAVFHPSEIL